MKEQLGEKLIQLATAQKKMEEMADRIGQWETSQGTLEKGVFEAMNISDTIVSLSKEGNQLVQQLQEYLSQAALQLTEQDAQQAVELLKEIHNLFHTIQSNAKHTNEIIHNFDQAVAAQREIGEEAKISVDSICESVASAVACAEFILAEL